MLCMQFGHHACELVCAVSIPQRVCSAGIVGWSFRFSFEVPSAPVSRDSVVMLQTWFTWLFEWLLYHYSMVRIRIINNDKGSSDAWLKVSHDER